MKPKFWFKKRTSKKVKNALLHVEPPRVIRPRFQPVEVEEWRPPEGVRLLMVERNKD